ncbi:MAG: hypothetical protein KJZ83_13945 [Burkholderiaceae bacterium]|nr:hypothetical protein [Burkholderiaceae bacterium]
MVWIIATNHPENLDGAAVRGRRFTAKVEFELPGSVIPAFTLSDSAVRERYQRKYEETAGQPALRRPGALCRHPGVHR